MMASAEAQLRLQLKTVDYIAHPGENGRAREEAVRGFIRLFVPPTFGVDTGFVTDIHGEVSKQLDIVVYRQDYHPVFEIAGVKHFMVESVAAVFENKASICSRVMLRTALDNLRSVKALDRTGGGWNYIVTDFHEKGSSVADDPRARIFAGVIAQQSMTRAIFLEEWKAFHAMFPREVWINTYVDLNQFALLYFAEDGSALKTTLYPEEAVAYGLTAPPEHGLSPMQDLAHMLVKRLRSAAVIDFNAYGYFPASKKHRDRQDLEGGSGALSI